MPFRRSYERFLVNRKANLETDKSQEQEVLLRDLSIRGAGIVSRFSLNENEQVKISIKEPFFDQPVLKEAVVIWSKKQENNSWRSGLDFGLDNRLELA